MTELSKSELIDQADALEHEAEEHQRAGREERAEELRDEAERLRAQSEGAPVGPSPDQVDAIVEAVHEQLDTAVVHLLAAQKIIQGFAELTDKILRVGLDIAAADVPEDDTPDGAAQAAEEAAAAEKAAQEQAASDSAAAEQAAREEAAKAESPAPEFDIEASVPTLLEYVGDDPVKAQAVLDAEYASAGPDRSTLVEPLVAIVEAAKAPETT